MSTKILLRAGMSPFDNYDPYTVLMKDSIGNNSGNLLYAYSVFKTLYTNDTEIDVDYYKSSVENAEEINSKYDYFVIPLANAFRETFRVQLKKLTDLVNALTIPCIVVGCGISGQLEPNFDVTNSFDEEAKGFLKAILNKSAYVGVRGELTAKYIEKLGFGAYCKVIGCPSMYMNGKEMYQKPLEPLNVNSRIAVTSSGSTHNIMKGIIEILDRKYPNYYFLPQVLRDLRIIYTGYSSKKEKGEYPNSLSNEMYLKGKARFFINVPSWIDFCRKNDYAIGTRLHGSIANILAGVPSLLIVTDARTRELAEFHGIPHVHYAEVESDICLKTLFESTDFSTVTIGHEKRFENFLEFLRLNGLKHIYEGEDYKKCKFDLKIEEIDFQNPVCPITTCSGEEIANRLELWYGHINRRINKMQKKIEGR